MVLTTLYGPQLPDLFGSVGRSMLTLFQLMTLDGWANEIFEPVIAVDPNALFLLLPFMLITAFAFLNLVIAVLVDAVERSRDEAQAEQIGEELDELEDLDRQILRELRDIRIAVADLQDGKHSDEA